MTKSVIESDLWMDEGSTLIMEIQKLKGIDIRNQEEVRAGIEILEALDVDLYWLLVEHEVFFDENGIETILDLYRKSVHSLKVYEGVDFEKAQQAYRAALRLIQLMAGLLYDSYYYWCRNASKIVQELI